MQTRILRPLFLFFGLIFVYLNPAIGQNCYVRLSDVSGLTPTQVQLDSLEYAACRLRDGLPAEFQSEFKVYDFGFYLHNETMVGGYPEAFQKAIDLAQAGSPYYLLFGKQTDKNGVYTRFWVKLKLPTNARFSCMTQLQREVYQLRVEKATVNNFKSNKNEYLKYYKAEIAGIQELYKIVEEIKDCCVANKGGVVQRSAGCLGCSDSLARQSFELQGFEKVNLNISTAAFANINTEKIKDYSFHKVTVGSQTGYLGEIMNSQVQNFNKWLTLNLLVTSYSSLCVDSISGSNLDTYKGKEEFNCYINYPSGEGLKASDIKITWNAKIGSWIKDENTANLLIRLLKCKIKRFLGESTEDCFQILSIHQQTANMNDMPEFDFIYAIYVQSLNAGVSFIDLIEGYKEFGGNETAAASDPDPEIQNGIDIISTSVAFTVPTTGTLIGRSRRSPPNVEDMQHGTNGDCTGIIYRCMTCWDPPTATYNITPPSSCYRPISDDDLKNSMRSLMTFFSKDPLESIAVSFAERFFNKISSDHYSTELSEHVRNSPNMRNYMKRFGEELSKRLKVNGGNIYLNPVVDMGNTRPVFGGSYNRWHGLTILLNDTEMTDVWYMGNFNLNNDTKVWSADFYFEVTDHFGLDKHDAIKYQYSHHAFSAWWALQHKRNYPPFRTKITIFATLRGKL